MAQLDAAAKPEDKAVDTELSPDDAADNQRCAADHCAGESARSPTGLYEFREERWIELYSKKIEEMIGVMKSKACRWCGSDFPRWRGAKATADMLFLDTLYRDAAGKAGITYVDVWDGFVDEAGRFLQQGPDFEGQIRRLRSYDGVYFTRPGARKLAHYVEREITRLLAARSAPIALRTNRQRPTPTRCPVSRRPVHWPDRSCRWWHPRSAPIIARRPGSRPVAVDALAARTLVKGEPLAPPAGRADDLSGRAVNRTRTVQGETPVASVSPDGTVAVRARRRSRKSLLRFNPLRFSPLRFNPARRRCGTFSDLGMHRASRRLRIRPPFAAWQCRTIGVGTGLFPRLVIVIPMCNCISEGAQARTRTLGA